MGLIGLQLGGFALYKFATGPTKNSLHRNFGVEEGSSPIGFLTSGFLETNLWSAAISAAGLWYVGNAHALAYGVTSFWSVWAAGSVTGAVFSKASGQE